MASNVEARVQVPAFNLREKLFILAIDDDKKRVTSSAKEMLRYGLAGALLAELAVAGRLRIEQKKLVVEDASPTGDETLDAILQEMTTKKPRKPANWVSKLSGKKVVRQVAERLAARNVIRIEEKLYLWVFPAEDYTPQDASAKFWLKQHLRSVVLAGAKAEPEDVILLSLVKGSRLLNLVFTRDERKAASKKVAALIRGEAFGEAVAEVLDEIDAAVAASAIAVSA